MDGEIRIPLELRKLFDAVCDETASAVEIAELEGILRADEAARRLFAGYCRMHVDLHFLVRGQRMQRQILRSLGAESLGSAAVILPEAPNESSAILLLTGDGPALSPSPLTGEGRGEGSVAKPPPTPVAPAQSPVLGFLGGVIDYVSHSRTLMFWLIFGSLGMYFGVQFGSLILSRFWAQSAEVADNGDGANGTHGGNPDNENAASGFAGKGVARLTNAIDCQWQVPRSRPQAPGSGPQPTAYSLQPLPLGSEFPAGQKLHLTAGLAELTFASGAQVILHAPANFTVTDPLGGELQLGKLVAKAPHDANGRGASGFTIATPAGKVVDLGTEFGVNVADDRTMHVIVYVGQVKVESESGTAANPGAAQAPVTVKAGEAIVIGPGRPAQRVAPQDERFVRDLEPLAIKGETEATYVEFMKKLKPVVWYRMEGKETDRVLHDEMGGPDAKLTWDGPGNPFSKGAVGKGLWLRDDPVKDGGAIVPDYPKADHDKLSVCAWAYFDGVPIVHDNTIACNWDDSRDPSGQFYFGLINRWPRVALGVIVQPREGKMMRIEEGAGQTFPLHQWQHVAFVHDGKSLHLYRQGREIPWYNHACAGVRHPVEIKALAIGAQLNATGGVATSADAARWSGKLDEIAIFNDALSAETIRKLAAFGP